MNITYHRRQFFVPISLDAVNVVFNVGTRLMNSGGFIFK
jgi:hypothetical protein